MDHSYTLLVLAIAASSLFLGTYILSRNPYHRPGRAFYLLMLLITVRSLFHVVLLYSPDEEAAMAWGKAIMAASILLCGSTCYLASFLPYSRYRGPPAQYARLFWSAIIVLAAVFCLPDYRVVETSVGYGLDRTPIALVGYGVCLLLASAASIIAVTARQGSRDASFRRSILLLAVAPLFPFVSIMPFMAMGMVPLLAPGLMITSLIYAYLVLKHKVLSIPSSGHVPKRNDAARGDAILMEGRELRPAYGAFLSYMNSGYSGLVICRRHPDRVREEMGAPDAPMLWLSTLPGPDRVDPASLNILLHSATAFIERSAPAVILLEGIEYLISQNSADKVLRMLYSLRDSVTVTGSKLIVLLDPDVLYEKDLALVEKEFALQGASARADRMPSARRYESKGPGPRFEPESRDPQSHRITKLPQPGHDGFTPSREDK